MEAKTPAKRALAVLDTQLPPVTAEPIAQRRISKKVRSGIEFMVMGDCKIIKDAAEKAGLSREHFTRELSKPHVAAYMREKVLKQLAIAAARAGATKIELLDCADSAIRDKASTFVLGLADIAPASAPALSVNLEIKAGWVIDISPDPSEMRALRAVGPPIS